MSGLTKQDLIQPWALETEKVSIPELGAEKFVLVKKFSAADRGKLEVLGTRFKEKKAYDEVPKVRLLTCALAICDEQGNRLFNDGELDAIGQMPATVVDRIFDAAARLNGLDKKIAEEQEKNSESVQS